MLHSKLPSPWLSSLLIAVSLLAAGCAANRRDLYVQDKASGYVFQKPITEVWPQVRTLMRERELPVREVQGGYEMATDWLMQGAPSSLGTSYVRYYVRGKHPTPETCVVEIFRQNRTTQAGDDLKGPTGTTGSDTNAMARDREMEWDVLQRVDPEGARTLRAEAEKAIK